MDDQLLNLSQRKRYAHRLLMYDSILTEPSSAMEKSVGSHWKCLLVECLAFLASGATESSLLSSPASSRVRRGEMP